YGVPQFAQSAVRFKASDAGLGSDIATVFGAELSLDIPAASGPNANTARLEGDGPGDGWLAGAGAGAGAGSGDGWRAGAGAASADEGRATKTQFGAWPPRTPLRRVPGAEPPRDGTPRAGVPDPAGRHLLVLARDPEGYRRLCQVISTAHLAGGEK